MLFPGVRAGLSHCIQQVKLEVQWRQRNQQAQLERAAD